MRSLIQRYRSPFPEPRHDAVDSGQLRLEPSRHQHLADAPLAQHVLVAGELHDVNEPEPLAALVAQKLIDD